MIKQSSFEPCKWGKNAHIQTFWPTIIERLQQISFIPQRLETEDGDFLDLAWSAIPVGNCTSPVLVLFHGLEGSVESPYIKRLFRAARKEGWVAILMHFRGCSGEPNKKIRRYHSGDTSDTDFLLRYLKKRFPKAPLFAIGFSLGGNALLKYQGEKKEHNPLRAAIAVSVPFKLDSCAAKLETGFSRVYQKYLMSFLKNNIKKKMSLLDYSDYISLSEDQIDKLKTFREFDEYITAPIHGFKGADDYYEKCSSKQYLKDIKNRTLIIQAKDDPFISEDAIPTQQELSENVTLELSDRGGHAGFISGGSVFSPHYWLEERIPGYIKDRLANRID